jgi:hypothetical protein
MKHIELFKEGFDSTVQEKIHTDTINYFYIESLEDNNVITLDSTTWAGYCDNKSKLEYSNNTTYWTSMNGIDYITINNGERLYIRCIDSNICKDINSIHEREEDTEIIMCTPLFKTSTTCNIGGNINTVMFDYTYKTEDCVLPIGALAGLFFGIDIMTETPANYIIDAYKLELPTITLNDYCYSYMFYMCTSLTTAPELPAATLAKECYYSMFENCANLNYVKCLATDISAEYCTVYWIWNVSSNGTFVKHPDMNDWITNYAGIPEGWTVVDAEL